MRDKTAKALISMGMPMNQTGFLYILDIMELYEMMNGSLYFNKACNYVAEKRKHKVEHIIENIQYSIDYVMENGNGAEIVKYFGFVPKETDDYLKLLFKKLKEDDE